MRLLSTKDYSVSTSGAAALAAINTSSASSLSVMAVITGTSPVGTIGLEKSNDGSTWVAEGAATAISAAGSTMLERVDPAAKYYRVVVAVTSGTILVTHHVVVKSLV